jgi:hypothetical protein
VGNLAIAWMALLVFAAGCGGPGRPDGGTFDGGAIGIPDAGAGKDAGAGDGGADRDGGLDEDGGVAGDGGLDEDGGVAGDGGLDGGATPGCLDLTESESPAALDRNDTPETAEALPGPGTYTGELQHGADVDVYAFEIAEAGALVRVAVDVGSGPMEAQFTVEGPRERPALLRVGQNPLSGSAAREVFFPVPGTYFVSVRDRRALEGAPPEVTPATFCYALRLVKLPAPVPADLPLPTGGTPTTATHAVGAEGALGFYRISTGTGGFHRTYVFNLVAQPARQGRAGEATRQPDVDPLLTIWDPVARRIVAENDDVLPAGLGVAENRNANLAVTLVAAGAPREYWVVVDHFALHNEDGEEHGEEGGLQTEVTLTVEEPIAVASGSAFVDETRALGAARQVQWYLVEAPAGRRISASVEGSAGGLVDVGVGIEDVSGASLGFSAPLSATAAVEGAALRSDRTLVFVTAFDDLVNPAPGVTGAYALTVGAPQSCGPVAGAKVPAAGDLALNEVLWNPDPVGGDASGDGRVDAQEDEFVEIVNTRAWRLDLGGVSLGDVAGQPAGTRFVFPCGTTLGGGQSVVVFGAGFTAGAADGAEAFSANVTLPCSEGGAPRSLCLDDVREEGLVVRAATAAGVPPEAGVELARLSFASLPGAPSEGAYAPGVAFVRCASMEPSGAAECDRGSEYVVHSRVPGVTAFFSPGARVDGTPFPPPPGERCESAELLAAPVSLTGQTTLGFANDYGGTECTGKGTGGPDRVYAVEVPDGAKLIVTVTPEDGRYDPALYLVAAPASSCDASFRVCLGGADAAGAGGAETVSYTNTTGGSRTVLIVVDSRALDGGPFALALDVGPP